MEKTPREESIWEMEEGEEMEFITDADLDIELPEDAWMHLHPGAPRILDPMLAEEQAAQDWEEEEMLQLGALDGADEELLTLLADGVDPDVLRMLEEMEELLPSPEDTEA